MKTLNGGNIIRLALDDIEVGDRLRVVREAQIVNLIAMAEDTGITTPIHVRKVGGKYHLIDGAHRLEASRRMGLADIACLVVECRLDEAKAMEASNNLGAARMTPLQTAVFVASWKRTYYDLHPERKPGVFKGNQYSEKVVTPQNGLTKAIADAFGRKASQIHKIMAVGEHLTESEVFLLDQAKAPVSLEDLQAIGKINDPDLRARVVQKIGLGAAKKVSEARRQIDEEEGTPKPTIKDPVGEAYSALAKLWTRAPLAAKKRFCLEFAKELWEVQNKGAALHKGGEADAE